MTGSFTSVLIRKDALPLVGVTMSQASLDPFNNNNNNYWKDKLIVSSCIFNRGFEHKQKFKSESEVASINKHLV